MNEHELYRQIDEILWSDWDPVGVNAFAPRDEYYSYVAPVLTLLLNDSSQEVIANKLNQFETITMGMPGDLILCHEIATKILKLKST